MIRRLPVWLALAALVAAAAPAGVGAWREATAQGWREDGLWRLVLDAFWERFDPWAGIALGVAVLALLALWLAGRWRPGRRPLVTAAALVAVAGLVRLGALAHELRGPGLPNVLLISIDTLRADRLGAYGHTLPTSPALDRRLAAEGVVFELVLAQSPKTTPSHITMLTSLYPAVHGIELWEGQTAGPVLNPRAHTLAEVLRNAGYATAAFTAGAHMHRARGFGQGFERYRHSDQLRRSRDWLRAKAGRSFFLFFHTYEVHDPYVPPPDLVARFDGDYGDGPIAEAVRRIRSGVDGWERGHRLFWDAVNGADPRAVRHVSRLYDAGIRQMDDRTLTALLDELDTLGLANDTLVVFTSDHGEAFMEHGRFLHSDLYEGTLHVPLVLRFPGRVPPGTRVAEPAGVIDIMPTVLDLLGIPAPPDLQGRSLAGLMRGAGSGGAGAPAVVSEYSQRERGRLFESLRLGDHVLIRDGESMRLFDRAIDPGEHADRAAADPVRVTALRGALERWRADCQALAARFGPRSTDAETPDADTLRNLRALGYVE